MTGVETILGLCVLVALVFFLGHEFGGSSGCTEHHFGEKKPHFRLGEVQSVHGRIMEIRIPLYQHCQHDDCSERRTAKYESLYVPTSAVMENSTNAAEVDHALDDGYVIDVDELEQYFDS